MANQKIKPCGDSHFSMDFALVGDTVMQKIRNCNLNMNAFKVYLYLSRNRDFETGKLHGSEVKKIADYWCISERSVFRGLADLINAGLYNPPLRGKEEITGVLYPTKRDSELSTGGNTDDT